MRISRTLCLVSMMALLSLGACDKDEAPAATSTEPASAAPSGTAAAPTPAAPTPAAPTPAAPTRTPTTPTAQTPQPPPRVQVEAECPADCRTMLAGLANWPRLAVWSVSYGSSDYVQVKNLSGSPVTFDGWHASTGGTTVALPTGITVDQSAFVMFRLGQAGASTPEEIYLEGLSLEAAGEFALFSSENLQSSDDIQIYVRWGAAPAEGEASQMGVAAEAGLWHARAYVPVCDGYTRFGAVGDNSLPRGFRSMPDECFPRRGR